MIPTIHSAQSKAFIFAELNNFAGPDPYDGLSSPLARILPGRLPRQAWVQTHKRLGKRLRTLTAVKPIRMAKAVALFATGCAVTGNFRQANLLVDDLLQMQNKGGPWGYEFDVQTRWGFYPEGSPNVVATAYALRAIDSVGRIDEVSESVTDWISSLWDPRGYFRYTQKSDALIHNGSLLAAESLARFDKKDIRIARAIETTVDAQEETGSWPYGRGSGLEWKDSFHTIYVLDSLSFLSERGIDVGKSVEKGFAYWKQHFFTDEMRPTYFADANSPSRDVHNIATVVGATIDYQKYGLDQRFIDSTVNYLLEFQAIDGGFRNSTRGLPFMRWNQAHAFLALSKYMAAIENREHEKL